MNQNQPRVQNTQYFLAYGGVGNSATLRTADPYSQSTNIQFGETKADNTRTLRFDTTESEVPKDIPNFIPLNGRRNIASISMAIDGGGSFAVTYELYGVYRERGFHSGYAHGYVGHYLATGTFTEGTAAVVIDDLPTAVNGWLWASEATATAQAYYGTNMAARYGSAIDVYNPGVGANAIADISFTELGDFEGIILTLWASGATTEQAVAFVNLGY